MKCKPEKIDDYHYRCENCGRSLILTEELPECEFNNVPDENSSEIKIELKESIKFITHSKGPPTWEIKLIDSADIEPQIDRLERINKKLEEKYGKR